MANKGDRRSIATISTNPGSVNSVDTILQIPDEKECQICLSDYPSSEMISGCSKQHIFCKKCLAEYLQTCLNSYRIKDIKCPQDGCTETFSIEFLKKVLDSRSFQIYEAKLLTKFSDKNVKICPKPGCSRGYKPQENSNYTVCKCGTKICNNCNSFWHNGKTCLEAMDMEFEAYSKENGVKPCIMCKSLIARVEGCPHITCPVCDYEWCWICGQEFLPEHAIRCPKEWMPLPPKVVNEMDASPKKKGALSKILAVLFLIWLALEMTVIFLVVVVTGVTCLLYLVIVDYERFKRVLRNLDMKKDMKKRWETRNAEMFHYTDAARPEEHIRDDAPVPDNDRQGHESLQVEENLPEIVIR